MRPIGDRNPPGRIIVCTDCGERFLLERWERRKARCTDCGEIAVAENIEQLSQKQGPYFDKWREAILSLGPEPPTTTLPLMQHHDNQQDSIQ